LLFNCEFKSKNSIPTCSLKKNGCLVPAFLFFESDPFEIELQELKKDEIVYRVENKIKRSFNSINAIQNNLKIKKNKIKK
jgi:hypothetical protein